MRKTTKTVGVFAAAAVMLTAGLSPAMAASVDTTSTVTGGALSSTVAGATLTGVTLDGSNVQTATGSSSEWSLVDARGTGAVWALTVTASVPTSAGGSVETVARTIPVGNLSITPGLVTAAAGSDPATGITAEPMPMTGDAQALVSATVDHKGTYTLTPSFTLAIPANTYRSNYADAVGSSTLVPYVSTITYTLG
jgi:hypothetical protein